MNKKHKWTLSTLQRPLACHLVVTEANAPYCKEIAAALEDCIETLKGHPEENNKGDAAFYGLAESVPN